jgi:hypothetical protein
MPDENQAAPETPDTPPADEAAPTEETQPSPAVDYESRYNNLRPEFDRKAQRLAELEAEREQWLQAQQEPEEEGDEYEYDYEDSVARQEIAELKALLAQRDQETQQYLAAERETAFVNTEIERLEKEQQEVVGEFSDDEWETLGVLSERFRKEDGTPDVDRAFEHLFGKIVKPRREKYVSTKKARKPGSGSAAAQSIDLDDPQVRREYMTKQLIELEGQQE